MNLKISFILLLWMCLFGVAAAQNSVDHRKQVIKYSGVKPNDNFYSVLSLLSVHNEKNIRSLRINISYRQFVQEDTVEGIKISWDEVVLKGDVRFRDFDFDTLIMPDAVKISFSWIDSKTGLSCSQSFDASFPGKNLVFKPSNYHGEKVAVTNIFSLSDKKLKRFINAVNIANHYYGYGVLLRQFKRKQSNDELVAPILNYIEIHRAIFNINRLNIVEVLHLKYKDPQKFLIYLKKAKRIETRRRTLAKQEFSNIDKGGEVDAFVKGIVRISVEYLSEKEHYQPYIASSFEQMAQLQVDDEIFTFYGQVCKVLDNYNQKTTAQQVFNRFLFQAGEYENSGAYVYSLLMLDNAKLWADKMKLNLPLDFDRQLVRSLDGLLSMYIKVASAGFRQGNNDMANKYVDKSMDLLKMKTEKYPTIHQQFLPCFQEELLETYESELKAEHYKTVADLLFRFKSLHYNKEQRKRMEEINMQVNQGLFSEYIVQVQIALDNGFTNEAYSRIEAVKSFQQLNAENTEVWSRLTHQLNKLAYVLVLKLVSEGEALLEKGKNREAMNSFAKALQLQDEFLDFRVEQLDALMNQTAIPIIMNKIDDAGLLVWANRIDDANNLYAEIVELQNYYHLENDISINKKVSELKYKLNNRNCVGATYSLSNYLQVVQNRIESRKWNEAAEVMMKATKVVEQNRDCKLDTVTYHRLNKKYEYAFSYVLNLIEVNSELYAYGYSSVWKEYADLDLYYQKHNLSDLGIPESGFRKVLLNKGSVELINKVVRYYLSIEESVQAFHYLLLLKNTKLPYREVKHLQTEVGRKMAFQLSKDQFESLVNNSDKWLQPLIKTYLLYKK